VGDQRKRRLRPIGIECGATRIERATLDDWVPRKALYMYYYNPSGLPRKLRVLIDFVRERLK
jgi:hypothetical protein